MKASVREWPRMSRTLQALPAGKPDASPVLSPLLLSLLPSLSPPRPLLEEWPRRLRSSVLLKTPCSPWEGRCVLWP